MSACGSGAKNAILQIMPMSPKLGAEALAANLADLHPALSPQAAVIEANRCLFCFDAPCIQACPTGIDIPSFIRKIVGGNPTGAARTILGANVLGASCARVCPTAVLCEGACVVLAREGDPVKIGRLQRHATDHVFQNNISVLKRPEMRSNRRIAVIGGGPAGLGCAAELAQLGHQPVVFEKQPNAGGLNTYGVAYYKMKPEVSLAEVELVKSLGVEFRCGVEVGRDIMPGELERDFDAIFIGVGLGTGTRLGIPGEHLPEVVDAVDFIRQIHTRPLDQIPVGERVAVIGCGNTAIDAVTQARRLGARVVTAIYRRGETDMPAYGFEYELARNDGGQFLFDAVPLEVMAGPDGHVSGLRLARTRVDDHGKVGQIPGSEFIEPFDMVIKAVGQEKPAGVMKRLFPKLELNAQGAVKYDFATGRTNLPKIFAGGDCANGGREVVNAVAEGKRAARGIHDFLTGEKITGPLQPSRLGVAGAPQGAGFDRPIRVTELAADYRAKEKIYGQPVR
jgi:dihydropyrimidine dehydrogenase (NAD+) subunit PreT